MHKCLLLIIAHLCIEAGHLPTTFVFTPYTCRQVPAVRISSPSHYQGVGKARGTQVDIQSEEKSSSDCMTIYKVVQKLPDHVTLSGTWYGP